jgi:hypothetical protein
MDEMTGMAIVSLMPVAFVKMEWVWEQEANQKVLQMKWFWEPEENQKRLRFAPRLWLSQGVCDKLKLREEEVAQNATAQRRGGRWTESCIPCCTGNCFGMNASTWVRHCMLQVAVTTCLLRVKKHGQLHKIKYNPQMF